MVVLRRFRALRACHLRGDLHDCRGRCWRTAKCLRVSPEVSLWDVRWLTRALPRRARDTLLPRKAMIYLKSLLAGLGALVAYCVLFDMFGMFGVRMLLPAPPVPKWTDLPEGVNFSSNSHGFRFRHGFRSRSWRSDCSFLPA